MTRCERCGREAVAVTCSRFNTETICMTCDSIERRHPKYAEASRAENAACARGDFNFAGIGLPDDLKGGGDDDAALAP